MKKKKLKQSKGINKQFTLAIVAAFAVVGAIVIAFSKAATPNAVGTLTLSPSSGTYAINSNFTVSLYEDGGSVNGTSNAVNAINIGLNYDQAKLQFVGIDSTGSSFPTCTEKTGGSGIVKLYCITDFFATPPVQSVTGSKLVAKITFKALAGTGTSALTFAKDYPAAGTESKSAIYKQGTGENIWNGVTTGGTYTLSGTTSNPPPTTGGGSGGTGSGGGTSSTTPKTTTSTGTSSKPKTTATTTQPTTGQSSTTPAANNSTPETAVPVPGYTIVVRVTGADGKTVAGASVKLDTQVRTTDISGLASFNNVTPGKYKVSISSKDGNVTKQINVLGASTQTEIQQFDVKLKKPFPYIYLLILPGLVVVGLLIRFIINKRAPWGRITPSGGGSSSGGSSGPGDMSNNMTSNPSVIVDPGSSVKPLTASTLNQEVPVAPLPPAAPAPTMKGGAVSVIQPADKPKATVTSPATPKIVNPV